MAKISKDEKIIAWMTDHGGTATRSDLFVGLFQRNVYGPELDSILNSSLRWLASGPLSRNLSLVAKAGAQAEGTVASSVTP